MKISRELAIPTLPTATDKASNQRITKQTLQVLDFIHRFRHVTARHTQLNLQHTAIYSTQKQLRLMCAKGYIDRRYSSHDRATNQLASYYLTPEGLTLLKARNPGKKYRTMRSVITDAGLSGKSVKRHHTLADVYIHFKRHYDGYFEFFSAFDIAGFENLPDEVPDGCIRTRFSDIGIQHYFVEIYGWSRWTQSQQRRLCSYLQFAESAYWEQLPPGQRPQLFIIAASQTTQQHLEAQLTRLLKESLVYDLQVYTTVMAKLDSDNSAIWRHLKP